MELNTYYFHGYMVITMATDDIELSALYNFKIKNPIPRQVSNLYLE